MNTHRPFLGALLLVGCLSVSPGGVQAQESRTDSLEARIKELEARLDSLLAVLGQARADSAAQRAQNELEVLRAAAREAAGKSQVPDTAQQSRTRNLNVLNPEISVTGDAVGTYSSPDEGESEFTGVPREFEFGFESALDPYTRTKIFISYEEELEIAGLELEEEGEEGEHGGFAIEEGYVYWVGLPANIGLKLGKFRQEIGLYNRWHTHALREVDRPLAAVAFLGDDGLIQTGAAVTLPTLGFGSATNVATVEITRSENEALFQSDNEISFLGNLRSFWDLGAATYFELGATGVYGEHDASDQPFTARLLGLHAAFRWRPPGSGLYRDFSLKGEYYFADRNLTPGPDLAGEGGYLQANYRLTRRWYAGARADYLDFYGQGGKIYQLVPSITWWQSEWLYLRLQYNFLNPDGTDPSHTVLLQTVWAIGPHKHEAY